MKASISKLHYITQEIPGRPHWQLAEEACAAGVRWLQLRLKNKSNEEIRSITLKTLEVCRQHNCKLILNDHVSLAIECRVDGIHLGKNDMDVKDARILAGDRMVIGGTSNTFDDIKALSIKGVDYIGLGPFRFTTTKEKLSPVLGIEGNKQIMDQCRLNNISIPVVAIGGITQADVPGIILTGAYGVAVASAIGQASNKKTAVTEFKKLLNINEHELRARQ